MLPMMNQCVISSSQVGTCSRHRQGNLQWRADRQSVLAGKGGRAGKPIVLTMASTSMASRPGSTPAPSPRGVARSCAVVSWSRTMVCCAHRGAVSVTAA
jgi:hypothetical protein